MAALAIPVVVLGSLYILSEQEKKKENFQKDILEEVQEEEFISGNNKENKEKFIINTIKNNPNKIREGLSNYNTRKLNDFNQQNSNFVNSYNNSNQHTDKYFMGNVGQTKNMLTEEGETLVNNQIKLMSGEKMDLNTFKHNNMQPYFGAKIRGASADLNVAESILDSKQGYGSQLFSKSEQAPMFKPDEHTNTQYGMQNNSDFQSRMNESMKMSNVTLWEQQRVGPGLNLGYGSQNEKGLNTGGVEGMGGFNNGMLSVILGCLKM